MKRGGGASSASSSTSSGAGGSPGVSECDDGIDNDGDGYTDWQSDQGCYGPGDHTEAAMPRAQEDGCSTLESYVAAARLQTRLNWRKDLTAPVINDYIRAGFN